ncbi:MAG TPA: hypothetical protein VGA67_02715 [Candidatus Dojkabacteria bacterium]|jgi:DNA-binding transcriptional regulator YhcF (GntR family)
MGVPDAKNILSDMAHGSFGRVVERNNRLFLIETKTIKVKNKILREFVDEARKDGFDDETIVDILLNMDEAVENNNVKQSLNQFL